MSTIPPLLETIEEQDSLLEIILWIVAILVLLGFFSSGS